MHLSILQLRQSGTLVQIFFVVFHGQRLSQSCLWLHQSHGTCSYVWKWYQGWHQIMLPHCVMEHQLPLTLLHRPYPERINVASFYFGSVAAWHIQKLNKVAYETQHSLWNVHAWNIYFTYLQSCQNKYNSYQIFYSWNSIFAYESV